MTASLPGFLQNRILSGTWTEKRRSHHLEFATEGGRPTRSKLPGSPYTDISFETVCDAEEVRAWNDFYATDCDEGATAFYAEDGRLGVKKTYLWADAPDWQHAGPKRSATSGNLQTELFLGRMAWCRE
jgi:hypothetical protein